MAAILSSRDTVSQVCLLMKRDYEAVGFLPFGAVEEAVAAGQVILQRDGADVYGYLIHGPIRPWQPVSVKQTLVDADARRLKAGETMFYELVRRSVQGYASRVRLRCAEGLSSNLFWQAMGFRFVSALHPQNTRKRAINAYEFNLQADLFNPSDLGKIWLPEGVRHPC